MVVNAANARSALKYRIIIRGQGMQRNGRTEQLSPGNGKIMELKLSKLDEAL